MADIRQVTERFSVAPQISLEDLSQLKAQGFTHIISNRPDGETPDQPTAAEVSSAASAAGLTFAHAPFVGQPTEDAVNAVVDAKGKTLAFCRSGTRSVTAWAIAAAINGEDVHDILHVAQHAGYNISGMHDFLHELTGQGH